MKVYLDTCIINSIVDLQHLTDNDADALGIIAEHEGLEFFVSNKVSDEIKKAKIEKRRSVLTFVEKLFNRISDKNIIINGYSGFGAIGFGTAYFGGGHNEYNPLFIKLRKYFDYDDSEHIFQAILANCDFFLTLDKKTIINPYNNMKSEIDTLLGKTKIKTPTQLAEII
jgi:predicted nucleic acid-binding protein